VIAYGREDGVLTRLASGEAIGTELQAQTGHLTARKQWMADHLHTAGQVVIDAGAIEKLSREGKSLLPIGVTEVRGQFGRGAVITCVSETASPSRAACPTTPAAKPGASCASRPARSKASSAMSKARS
jgi:glutamate 5-kinase